MSRVLLLSSNTMTEPYPAYPLGMAMVASALSSSGHSVCQFDYLAEGGSRHALGRIIRDFNPDFVGVSIRNIDTVDSFTADETWSLASDRTLIEAVREATNAPVVLGGPAFSIMPEEILAYVNGDYGIVGDGGGQLNGLIDRLNRGQRAPAILRNEDAPEDAGIHFRPLWNKKLIDYYTTNHGVIGLQTKRGCPHKCTYCTYPVLEGNRYIHREPGVVTEDILQLKKDHCIDTICFTDSVFNDSENHYLLIAEELLRRAISIKWSAFFEPSNIKSEDLRILKRAGLYSIEVGTDAASDTTIAGLNKHFCFDDVVHFNETCLKEMIPCAHYMIFGGPGETENTIRTGLDNITFLKHCVVFAFSGIRILPGTALHKIAMQDGLLNEKDPLLKPVFYFSPGIEASRMNEILRDASKHIRNLVFPPSAGQAKLKVLHRFGYQGALWHKMISFDNSDTKRARA